MLARNYLTSYQKGIFFEYLSILLLFFKGYKLIYRRYYDSRAEIDLIVKKGNYLIFIEVKRRRQKYYLWDLIKTQERQRKRWLAERFCKRYQLLKFDRRFDIIFFSGFNFTHIKNAF